VLADRRELRATRRDLPDFAAFREVLPNMPEEQAKLETTQAIACAFRRSRPGNLIEVGHPF